MITYRPPVSKQDKKASSLVVPAEYATKGLDEQSIEAIQAISRSGRIDFQASQMCSTGLVSVPADFCDCCS